MNEQHLHLLALSLTKGLGPVSVKNMIAYCGSAQAVFDAPSGKLKKAPGIGKKVIERVKRSSTLERAQKEVQFCQQKEVEILTYLDPDYPTPLKYIHDAPLILFKKGKVNLNAQVNVAIVGTRKATSYGKELSRQFAKCFSSHGLNVVSGLAYGIDIEAHKAVLQANGITTAVLGHGIDTIYPSKHLHKALDMQGSGGLLTEYLTGTKPDAPHFPARNRIISGISKAIIVIEAAKSGGALITAKCAFDQNRQVYAIPGRIGDTYSEGCNKLIRDDIAKLVLQPEDVLEDLQIQWQNHDDRTEQLQLALNPPEIPLSTDESKVLNYLAQGDAVIDQISLKTGIPIHKLNSILLSMEFKELLLQLPGKKYVKKSRQ